MSSHDGSVVDEMVAPIFRRGSGSSGSDEPHQQQRGSDKRPGYTVMNSKETKNVGDKSSLSHARATHAEGR